MKKILVILLMLSALPLSAQVDRKEVRSGNRKFRKGEFAQAELEYRKAVLKDSVSVAGEYNLASSLYRQENYEEAAEALGKADSEVAETPFAADYYYNEGDVALARKDWPAAVKAFRQSLLLNPGDLDAKENYAYAKEMLKNQQGGGGGQNDQNQQNQPDRQPQDQPQNQDDQQDQPREGISQQQARQMLRAVQAQEKETQDKVNKEKAALLKSSAKEKNW